MIEHPLPWRAREAGPFDPGDWVVVDANDEVIFQRTEGLIGAFSEETAHFVERAANAMEVPDESA